MRYLVNLASRETLPGTAWGNSFPDIPDEVRKDKGLRDKWITDSDTSHCCYNTWEGINENLRIAKRKGADNDEENPPHRCHGVIADFDTVLSMDELSAGFEKFSPLQPTYYGRSLSGKAHLVWVFDAPITVAGWKLAEKFLEVAVGRLKLKKALPSLDEPAVIDPCKYYTSGNEWFEVGGKLSTTLVTGWLFEASKKLEWTTQGYCVPLEVVKKELLKDARFETSWAEIDFAINAQGPTWWIGDSTSPKSAVVKESGMFTFSGHAPKNFYPWSDLLGLDFVQSYKDNHIGQAVEGILFDGRNFWHETPRRDWKCYSKDDILSFLKVTRKLSVISTKQEPCSEREYAYEHILAHQNINGAAPFVFRPSGILNVEGSDYLNVSTKRVLPPFPEAVQWSDMPWLSKFFGPPSCVNPAEDAPRFFVGGIQPLDSFLSWLAYYYGSAHAMNLASGHNVFMCGPANMGKTLLNRAIIGGLMNGFREAREYLMGEDTFGAELFSYAHWVVDDNSMGTSVALHRKWTEMIKRMAANKTFRYHEKFRTPQQVQWQGRVVVTLNDDEESARGLPDVQRSVMDKIWIGRTSPTPTVDFPAQDEITAILKDELPKLARFLLDWEVPEHCIQYRGTGIDYRFGGVKPWHDPTLVTHANQSSRTAGFYEILADWKETYFKVTNDGKTPDQRINSWTGSAFQLRKEICALSPAADNALRGTDNTDIGRDLASLKAKGYNLTCEDRENIRYWTIFA